MASKNISLLTAATTPLAGTELVPVWDGGGTKKVSVDNLTAGKPVAATQFTASTGNFIPAISGKGIDFSANTPAAGMTSQLLNWYEEGTWTPVVTSQTGILTSYTASGTYTRIGRQVTIEVLIILTNIGTGAGELHFTLPFNSVSSGNGSGFENGNTGFQLSVFIGPTSNYASVVKYDSTTIIALNNVIRAGATYFT